MSDYLKNLTEKESLKSTSKKSHDIILITQSLKLPQLKVGSYSKPPLEQGNQWFKLFKKKNKCLYFY